jgi:hypothetical protein
MAYHSVQELNLYSQLNVDECKTINPESMGGGSILFVSDMPFGIDYRRLPMLG